MIHLRKLASAVCLALLLANLPARSNAQNVDLVTGQVYNTGNLTNFGNQSNVVTSTWQNAGTIGQPLTCWAGGDPGYCGPQPMVAAGGLGTNSINFSYGLTDLYQLVAIKNALPNSGVGLQVNGFNFGFTAKNGNGWDDGRQDYLTAYVKIYDNTNSKVLQDYNYDLNSKYNWTTFNFSETFTKPYGVPDLGNARYGFVGRDNNFWAGPYGPEISNVNFSLKYSVDPCSTNPLYSPECKDYFTRLAALAPSSTASTTSTTSTSSGVITVVEGVPITPTGTYGPPPPPGSPPPPEGSQPPPPPPPSGPAPAGGPPSPNQQQASAPPPGGPQPKAGEPNESSGSSKSTVSLSSVLSMISANQEKTSALEKSVVQAADAQAFSAGETAKQNAEKIAGETQSQSIANSGGSSQTTTGQSLTSQSSMQMQGSSLALQGNPQSNAVMNTAKLQQSLNSGIEFQSDNSNSTSTSQQQNAIQNNSRQDFSVAMATPSVSYSLVSPRNYTPQIQIETPMLEGIKFGNKSPVENAMEAKPVLPQTNNENQQNDTVKKNVQNNEAAGNVTIDSIAKQPTGYAQYFSALPDVQFYAPKEIYKGQKTVDNARALRQLSSDTLHQKMIEQQYDRR